MPNVDRPDPGEYLRAAIPLLFWMGVIFFFSSLPGSAFPGVASLPALLFRKAAHVGEFLVLTLLAYRFFRIRFRENVALVILAAMSFSLAFATLDEFHQTFVPGREGKIPDVAIDSIGIVIAAIALVSPVRRRK